MTSGGILRVPIVGPDKALPPSTRVRPVNLDEYLQPDKVASKDDLHQTGVSEDYVEGMIAAERVAVMALVNTLLENAGKKGLVFRQDYPATSIMIEHNLGRQVVQVTVYSLDYSEQWVVFDAFPLDENRVQLSFDDPMTFVALVL